jgi:hypothetical protein
LAGHPTDFFSAVSELAYTSLANCPYNFSIILLKLWGNIADNKKLFLRGDKKSKTLVKPGEIYGIACFLALGERSKEVG